MFKFWIPVLATLTFASSCSSEPNNSETTSQSTETSATETQTPETSTIAAASTPEAPANAEMPAAFASAFAQGMIVGTVIETMDASTYTYVKLDTPEGELWAAGPTTPLRVGQAVGLADTFPMENFQSAALNRTFDTILFCSAIQTADSVKAASKAPHAADAGTTTTEPAPASAETSIARAENGQTIGEVLGNSADFVGTEVLIRARVVKYNAAIMKKNWLHLQDGTGEPGKDDLTITTSATAAVGDIVLIRGKLIADKDFGFGYKYDLIVEDAEVTVQ